MSQTINHIGNLKVFALSLLVVVSNVVGNSLLNAGVKSGNLGGWAAILRLTVSPALVGGVVLLIAWMLLRMALLSTSPMTIALPMTAGAGYLLTAGIGRFWFAEKVPVTYGYGLILIVAGVFLVGTSATNFGDAGHAPTSADRLQRELAESSVQTSEYQG